LEELGEDAAATHSISNNIDLLVTEYFAQAHKPMKAGVV